MSVTYCSIDILPKPTHIDLLHPVIYPPTSKVVAGPMAEEKAQLNMTVQWDNQEKDMRHSEVIF